MLPIIGGLDAVTRPLAMLAASPSVEGLVLQDGALLDFGSPLWPDARFTGFVLTDADVPDVTVAPGAADGSGSPLDDAAGLPFGGSPLPMGIGAPAGGDDGEPVTVAMLQPVPATPNELALARAKGVPELRALWRDKGTVLADPHRAGVV